MFHFVWALRFMAYMLASQTSGHISQGKISLLNGSMSDWVRCTAKSLMNQGLTPFPLPPLLQELKEMGWVSGWLTEGSEWFGGSSYPFPRNSIGLNPKLWGFLFIPFCLIFWLTGTCGIPVWPRCLSQPIHQDQQPTVQMPPRKKKKIVLPAPANTSGSGSPSPIPPLLLKPKASWSDPAMPLQCGEDAEPGIRPIPMLWGTRIQHQAALSRSNLCPSCETPNPSTW